MEDVKTEDGRSLSPLLFVISMNEVIWLKRLKRYRNLESECAFADAVTIAENERGLQSNLPIWNETLLKYGMKMNKTLIKERQFQNKKKDKHKCRRGKIERVSKYQYKYDIGRKRNQK